MDPLSTAGAALGVAGVALKVFKELDNIIQTLTEAPEILLMARNRVDIFRAAVQNIENTPERDPEKRAQRDRALEACGLVLRRLEVEIANIAVTTTAKEVPGSGGSGEVVKMKMSARTRILLAWNKDKINQCSTDLAEQATFLSLLLQSQHPRTGRRHGSRQSSSSRRDRGSFMNVFKFKKPSASDQEAAREESAGPGVKEVALSLKTGPTVVVVASDEETTVSDAPSSTRWRGLFGSRKPSRQSITTT